MSSIRSTSTGVGRRNPYRRTIRAIAAPSCGVARKTTACVHLAMGANSGRSRAAWSSMVLTRSPPRLCVTKQIGRAPAPACRSRVSTFTASSLSRTDLPPRHFELAASYPTLSTRTSGWSSTIQSGQNRSAFAPLNHVFSGSPSSPWRKTRSRLGCASRSGPPTTMIFDMGPLERR